MKQGSVSTKKRILGCLYGQAVGDAMGMPAELWPKSRVARHFGWIDRFLPGPEENLAANPFAAGQFTDDTGQCIALMDALIASDGAVCPQTIADHLLLWAQRIRAFENNILGPVSKASLAAIADGVPCTEIEANGVTNGSVMRVAPIGCLMPSEDAPAFIEAVRLSCLPTHKSDIAIAGAAVVAWSISRAIEAVPWTQIKTEIIPLADRVQREHESTFSPLLGKRIHYALDLLTPGHDRRQQLNDLYESVGAGMNIIESIPSAIAIVELADTKPMLCAELCANLGGDSDTIGAIASAICGALHGIDAFDETVLTLINETNDIDFTPYANALMHFRLHGSVVRC